LIHNSTRTSSVSLTIALAALISAAAWGKSTECTNAGLTRSIEVVYSDPGHAIPCEVIYDKSAEGAGQHSLWRADNQAGYCEDQAAAFVDKLRGLGWTCGVSAMAAPAAIEEPATVDEPATMPAVIEGEAPIDAPAANEEEAAGELLGESPAEGSGTF